MEAKSSAVSRLDGALFSVEKGIVTLAAVMMTVTVSLDILHRFAISDFNLAIEVVRWFGVEWASAPDWSGALGSSLALFMLGYGGGALLLPKDKTSRGTWLWGLAVGLPLGWRVLAWALSTLPSTTVLSILAGTMGLAMTVRAQGMGRVVWFGVGALGVYGAQQVRQDYIWSQELSLILLSWMAFMGGSMATRLQKHITVDALSKLVPTGLKPHVRALSLVVTTLFCLYITILAFEHVFGEFGDFNSGETRPSTGLPAWMITFPVLLAFSMMTLRFGGFAVDGILRPKAPEERSIH